MPEEITLEEARATALRHAAFHGLAESKADTEESRIRHAEDAATWRAAAALIALIRPQPHAESIHLCIVDNDGEESAWGACVVAKGAEDADALIAQVNSAIRNHGGLDVYTAPPPPASQAELMEVVEEMEGEADEWMDHGERGFAECLRYFATSLRQQSPNPATQLELVEAVALVVRGRDALPFHDPRRTDLEQAISRLRAIAEKGA